MLERPLLWRLGLFGSGLLLTGIMWMCGLFASKQAIVIDYAMLGEEAIGAEVFIDDELVGELEFIQPSFRTGFEVEEGAHVVRIVHPAYGCEPIRVETQGSRSSLLLRLDIAEYYDAKTGGSEPRIVFDR